MTSSNKVATSNDLATLYNLHKKRLHTCNSGGRYISFRQRQYLQNFEISNKDMNWNLPLTIMFSVNSKRQSESIANNYWFAGCYSHLCNAV